MLKYADTYLDSTLSESETALAIRDTLKNAIAGMKAEAYQAAAKACFSIQLKNQLDKITVPTLVLIGEEDFKTPIELSKNISEKIVNSELKVIPKGRHLSNVDEPEIFNQLTMEFLNKLDINV